MGMVLAWKLPNCGWKLLVENIGIPGNPRFPAISSGGNPPEDKLEGIMIIGAPPPSNDPCIDIIGIGGN